MVEVGQGGWLERLLLLGRAEDFGEVMLFGWSSVWVGGYSFGRFDLKLAGGDVMCSVT